jgi:hypothetical protein
MEIIGKISKGTKMDQIYISKERVPGFEIGETVLIRPIQKKEIAHRTTAFYYNIKSIEPVKNIIIKEIFRNFDYLDNIIITGSFLESGFGFEDIDMILITEAKIDLSKITLYINNNFGLNVHIITMSTKNLLDGLSMDPLFQLMLSNFISKKRIIFKKNKKINYKLLDLYLLKSKILFDNYDFLTGKEKYKLTRNLFAILLFLNNQNITLKSVNSKIKRYFGKDIVKKISENMLEKKAFLKVYKKIYNKTFNKIMNGIKNESK